MVTIMTTMMLVKIVLTVIMTMILCSPAGAITVLPTILYLTTSTLKEAATKEVKTVTK